MGKAWHRIGNNANFYKNYNEYIAHLVNFTDLCLEEDLTLSPIKSIELFHNPRYYHTGPILVADITYSELYEKDRLGMPEDPNSYRLALDSPAALQRLLDFFNALNREANDVVIPPELYTEIINIYRFVHIDKFQNGHLYQHILPEHKFEVSEQSDYGIVAECLSTLHWHQRHQ